VYASTPLSGHEGGAHRDGRKDTLVPPAAARRGGPGVRVELAEGIGDITQPTARMLLEAAM
jgi:hypothetical protein